MGRNDAHPRLLSPSPVAAVLSYVRTHWTLVHLMRFLLACLLTTLFTIGSWSDTLPQLAYAQSGGPFPSSSLSSNTPVSHTLLAQQWHGLQQPSVHATRTARTLTSQAPFDGLGDVSFFTYITFRIDDRVELKVNVANGNLLAHTSDLHIHGTGIDESVEGYYNSQAVTVNSDHGNNWNFSLGHDVRLDISQPSSGITLHGPSGYAAFFAPNGTNVWSDAPGLNATLTFNSSTQYYTLTFHRTGEQWLFGPNSHLAEIEDKNGNQIASTYNSSHDLLSLLDTQGRTTTLTHTTVPGWTDPTGEITKLTDPASRTVTYSYGERGNPANSLTTLTDTSGAQTLFDYSGADLTSVTDPMSHVTKVSYLTGDKVSQITDATGNTLSFTYHSGNTVVTDRNGNQTTYDYNALWQVTKVTDPLNHTRTTSYDANYDVSQYGDALSDLSVFTFSTDGKHNLQSVTIGQNGSSVGPTTSFGYPTSGNTLYYPQSSTDAQGNQTTYAYDSNGNLTSATNTKTNGKVQYFYNSNGTVNKIIDPDNNVTLLGYDTNNDNLTSVTPQSPLGGFTLTYFSSNPLSRVKCVTDGNTVQTCYQYDALDRVTSITYNGTGSITYSYDANGNLLSETDNTGTTSFTYDALNRLKTKTLPGGTVLTTTYDANGNLLTFTDGSGTTTYGYDKANNMTSLTEPDGTSITHYVYDAENRKVVIQYPNGTGMTMAYNTSGQLTSIVGGLMNSQQQITTTYSSFSYSYLKGTTPTSLVQTVDLLDPVNWQSGAIYHRVYSYDGQNRLTDAVVYPSGSTNKVQEWTYQYDAAGNRTQATVFSPSTTTTYSYPTQGANELASTTQGGTTTTYSYDGMGNLTSSSPGTPLAYNNKNQTKSNGSNNYTYSGPDQRDRVKVNSDTFVYSGLGLSSQTDSGGTTYYSRCSCGLLNHETLPNGQKYYYLFDGLMSVVGLTGQVNGGSIGKANAYDYDPYGVMLNQSEYVTNPWKYAGGYLDSTGLYKFGVRYYNPTLGRWTQQDPVGGSLGDLNSANRYVYANDNPVNAVDPSGKAVGDCGSSAINITSWPFGVGQVSITISLVSSWGPISWWGGTLFITGMGSATAIPVWRLNVNSSVATASFFGYSLGLGAFSFLLLGLAGLANGNTCAIVATNAVVLW